MGREQKGRCNMLRGCVTLRLTMRRWAVLVLSMLALGSGTALAQPEGDKNKDVTLESPGQIQERGLPGLPMPQPPGAPAMPSPPPRVPGSLVQPSVHPPHLVPSQFYAEREKIAPPAVRQKLAELRAKIQRDKLTFNVGYTGVAGRRLEDITGLKPPGELPAQAAHQNAIASEILRLEQQAIEQFEKLAASLGRAHLPEVSLRAHLPPTT